VTQSAATAVSRPQPGTLYTDTVGGAVVLVLTGPALPGTLRCNGTEMVPSQPLPCSYHYGSRTGHNYLRPGGRYRDVASGLEVRCLRAGADYITFGHRILLWTREARTARRG
jgi:hypothetical protein